MNIINVTIDFTKGINKLTGINLITGDYASTKMIFEFDRTDGTKVLEMKNPSGEVVYLGEIVNNEVLLTSIENGLNYSIFETEGRYIYEVSLYNGDSKLTSVKGELPVAKEQVIIDGEVVEPYLPLFDELMQEINTAITETNNINVSVEKESGITTIVLTKKDSSQTETIIEDLEFRWEGTRLGIKTSSQSEYQYVDLKGAKGDPGSIKIRILETLPQTGDDDTIYLIPYPTIEVENLPATGTQYTIYIVAGTGKRYVYESNQWIEIGDNNKYIEYLYVNNEWEILGQIGLNIDLSDYYTKQETNDLLDGKQNTIDGSHKLSSDLVDDTNSNNKFVTSQDKSNWNAKEDSSNKVTSISSSSTDTQYPSAKCVYDIVGNIESILETLDIGSGV